MSGERLEPLEALEKDYYLDDRGGWYSDGEQRDSESSDDELREKLSKLAGVRCQSRKRGQRQLTKQKDEFESDMDDELNECFVAHASQMFRSSASRSDGPPRALKIKHTTEDDEMPALVSDTDEDVAEPQTVDAKKEQLQQDHSMEVDRTLSSTSSRTSSEKARKSVTFASNTELCSAGEGKKCDELVASSSFDDENNLLRKAANKAAKTSKKHTADFYDSDEDDDNERWVRQHREQLKIVKARPSSTSQDSESPGAKHEDDEDTQTDAVLSCPACMSLLTRDCQRHEFYREQYRAIFVENCTVVENEVLFFPQSRKNRGKTRRNAAGFKPNTTVDPANVAALPKEDLFHPVRCNICSTSVGVYDCDEVFHFFNVLSGYA